MRFLEAYECRPKIATPKNFKTEYRKYFPEMTVIKYGKTLEHDAFDKEYETYMKILHGDDWTWGYSLRVGDFSFIKKYFVYRLLSQRM